MKPHKIRPFLKTGFKYCEDCGLIILRNWITDLCVKLGCEYKDNEQYKAWLKSPKNYPK